MARNMFVALEGNRRAPLPVILVGEQFWRRAVDFDFLAEEGMIDAEDLALFEFAETVQEIWERILGWYALRNQSIFGAAAGGPGEGADESGENRNE